MSLCGRKDNSTYANNIILNQLILSIASLMFSFIKMKKILILLTLVFNTIANVAFSESPIIGLKSIDIIRGWRENDKSHMAAIRIEMEEGWKTYWRVPGLGGIPPLINWNESKNIKKFTPIWPAPYIYKEYGLRTIGYKNELVLPLRIQPIDISKPIYFSATIDFGICDDVCVPIQSTIKAELPKRTSIGKNIIKKALTRKIISGIDNPIKFISCDFIPVENGFEIIATLKNSNNFDEDSFGVIEYPMDQNSWVSQKTSSVSNKNLKVIASLHTKGINFIDRSNLNLTIFSKNEVIEFNGCSH